MDNEEGLELLSSLVEAINTTWERRHELVAVEKATKAPRPLDVYTLLPQTNCTECGEATCMAFAVKLLLQEQTLEECSPLFNDESFEERRATLEAMILA
jgi:ArsR family metal-binding transcriptional regulator